MVYTCARCLFTFERSGNVDLCPDCGSPNVCHATDDEVAEHKRNKEQSELVEDVEQPHKSRR